MAPTEEKQQLDNSDKNAIDPDLRSRVSRAYIEVGACRSIKRGSTPIGTHLSIALALGGWLPRGISRMLIGRTYQTTQWQGNVILGRYNMCDEAESGLEGGLIPRSSVDCAIEV